MNLLETYDSLLQDWRKVFSQNRTFERARRLTRLLQRHPR